jgi:hypothetical protein
MCNYVEIRNALYSRSADMNEGPPTCELYYVYTGAYRNNAEITAEYTTLRNDLVNEGFISGLELQFIDAALLRGWYRSVTRGRKSR